ncbi:MAG: type II toxin-antitoxin system RelE/ParE family toxin [Candidatus Pacebacteria bacterium]|nr:type II toxin-antitoxin system RelE/ParE family toxin [Candidatus Paceibacterota bacterium]
MEIKEYLDRNENSPFSKWFNDLDVKTALKVNTYVTRMEQGNFSQVKSVGNGVSELVMDWGAGYRVYFGKDGKTFVILLGGGTKKRQQNDIEKAKLCWQNYKKQKKER